LKNSPLKRRLKVAQSLLLLQLFSQSLLAIDCYGVGASTDSFFTLIAAEPAKTNMVLKGIYDPDKSTTSGTTDSEPATAANNEATVIDSDEVPKQTASRRQPKPKVMPRVKSRVKSRAK
jgi:hypothetical protein